MPKLYESSLAQHFSRLEHLDISNNGILDFSSLTKFKSVVFLQASGNKISEIPPTITDMKSLKYLYLGNNKLAYLTPGICRLENLELLALNNNKLKRIPETLVQLKKLRTIHLHYNQITVIPAGLVKQKCKDELPLQEITLRGNPLLDKFVKSRLVSGIKHKPPSLFELACRSIKTNSIEYNDTILPPYIIHHLETAIKCPNPKCAGVYFDTKYFQVRFVDCCGAYKLPLLQYLCSPNCAEVEDDKCGSSSSSSSDMDSEQEITQDQINYYHRRVVLGGVDNVFSDEFESSNE